MALERRYYTVPWTKEEVEAFKTGQAASDHDYSSRIDHTLTPKTIVEAFERTGEYYDIDYPGGILQFVKDYKDGRI